MKNTTCSLVSITMTAEAISPELLWMVVVAAIIASILKLFGLL